MKYDNCCYSWSKIRVFVFLQEKFGKDWVTGKEVPGDCFAATQDGLKEGCTYEFRVRAINKAGPGEPSDSTKPIVAKCRFGE